MKIKSTYKDYYDHQAHIYGGGDPRITYVRAPIQPTLIADTAAISVMARHHDSITLLCAFPRKWADVINPRWVQHGNDEKAGDVRWLAIAGRLFLLVGMPTTPSGAMSYTVVSEKNPDHAPTIYRLTRRRPYFLDNPFQIADLIGGEEPALIPLSRALGSPVFIISGFAYIAGDPKRRLALTIETTIPIIGDLGIPTMYAPSQIYQDIAYFIGNTLHESPDIATPVSVSDRDRIIQHGFDVKVSFRHRK